MLPALPSNHNKIKPPLSPALVRGGVRSRFIDDSAKYILMPDEDFARPWLAIPGGDAFVWPLGTEGFELQTQAQLGLHKYLGEIELDVSVVHRAEKHITLSGVFPGWTSDANMRALQAVFEADTPENGKVLSLPGIFTNFNYVTCETLSFNHDEGDRTQDIHYSLSMVKVGLGKRIKQKKRVHHPGKGKGRGKGKRYFTANNRYHTLRTIARKLFKNVNRWTELYQMNAQWFDNHQPPIPTHEIPDYRIPNGHRVRY